MDELFAKLSTGVAPLTKSLHLAGFPLGWTEPFPNTVKKETLLEMFPEGKEQSRYI